jgi:hypothetical protein
MQDFGLGLGLGLETLHPEFQLLCHVMSLGSTVGFEGSGPTT